MEQKEIKHLNFAVARQVFYLVINHIRLKMKWQLKDMGIAVSKAIGSSDLDLEPPWAEKVHGKE